MFGNIRPLLTLLVPLSMAGVPLLMAGCDSGHHDRNYAVPTGPLANIQFLHASPDAPRVAVLIDGQLAVPKLDYGQGTGEQSLSAESHTIAIQAQTPGTPTTVIGPTTLSLSANMDYVVVAEGPVASIGPVVFPHQLADVGPDVTQVQILHAAPEAPSVSVYVTAPGADLASSAPLGTVSFKGSLGPTQVSSGQYEIRVTAAGTVTPVLFDSGTITLPGGADLVIAAQQNTGPGSAPIFLSSVDALGNNSRILDVGTPSNLRVVHDSPDAPPVSVVTNGNTTTPLVPSLAYEAFTPYVSLTPGTFDIEVTPASNTAEVLINQTVELAAGAIHTVYAVGDLANIQPLITYDDDRRLATQAKLRIIHGAPSAGPVDIYLTAPGAMLASTPPTYGAVSFPADTGFVSYAAGSYELTVTAAGSKTPVIGPLSVSLSNKGIYTAVARDAAGGGAPYGLILLDDFAAAN